MSEEDGVKPMGQVIQIDESRIRNHLWLQLGWAISQEQHG
jgi:hypothetical protein